MDGIEQTQNVETLETESNVIRSDIVTEVINKDSEYEKKLKDFKKTQEKRIQTAEKKLLPRCTGCSKALRSKLDAESYTKNGSCFTCYTTKEKFKTELVIEKKLAEEYDRMAALDFPDFENLLFGDESGKQSLMRVFMKIRREGYDLEEWQVSLVSNKFVLE